MRGFWRGRVLLLRWRLCQDCKRDCLARIIPSNLAYGEGGMPQGGISPFSPLVFEVELSDIKKPVAAPAGTPGATISPVTPAPATKK